VSIEPFSSSAVPTHPLLAAADAIEQALASVADVNPTFMSTEVKAEAMRRLAVAESRLAELKMRVLADAQDVAMENGSRDAGVWLAHETRTGQKEAKADLALATELDRNRQLVAAAMRTGAVNVPQARVIVRALDALAQHVDPDVLDKAETHLVTLAADHGPRALAKLGRKILDVIAPEIAEEIEARRLADLEADAHEATVLRLRRKANGRVAISGELDPLTGTRLAIYLEAWTNPRRAHLLDPTDGTSGDDGTPTSHPDSAQRLPHPRRLGQAFCSFLEAVDPKRLPIHGGNATQLLVTIDFDSLRKMYGVGDLLTTGAVSGGLVDGIPATGNQLTAAQVRRLACNAEILPVVLGGKSEILDYGRARRLYSPAQQRAMLLRDRTCRAEGCDIPGTWAEAHHWIPWGRFGKTDLADGVLLCSHHHHCIHDEDRWTATRLPNGDVRFHRRR
jgi:hypothetical protein